MALSLLLSALSIVAIFSVSDSKSAFKSVKAEKNVFLISVAIVVMSAMVRGWLKFPVSLTRSSAADREPCVDA